jgi:hypothetical protein
MPTIGLMGAAVVLASCGTPEFRAERSLCQSTWLSKIPPAFVQRIVNETRSRQVPTGRTICETKGTKTICDQVMRTEYYTVPVVRTIDRNKQRRDVQIKACTQQSCAKRFGNPECKPA